MTAAAAARDYSPLESALSDVNATLAELLATADEQHAAVVDGDRDRLESVTRRQEHLSTRLERAERRRLGALHGAPLQVALADLPSDQAAATRELVRAIALRVVELRERNARTSSLIERSADLAAQTVQFLQRLVTAQGESYTPRGLTPTKHSLLVDTRA